MRAHKREFYEKAASQIVDKLDAAQATIEALRKQHADRVALLGETITANAQQIMRLGQCVVCGEMDGQDGVHRGGEFRCVGCVEDTLRKQRDELVVALKDVAGFNSIVRDELCWCSAAKNECISGQCLAANALLATIAIEDKGQEGR